MTDDTRAIEAQIRSRIRDFDVSSLLELLAELGLPNTPEGLGRAGHPSRVPRSSWLEDIRFERQNASDDPAVMIDANLGLLSCRSPLPDYFMKLMVDPTDAFVGEPLVEFLSVLDDRLLARRFSSYRPEEDSTIIADWPLMKRDMLCLGAKRSSAALHSLFRDIFPELRVSVLQAPRDHSMPAPNARLGSATLSRAALGGLAHVPVRAMEVLLCAAQRLSSLTDTDGVARPWGTVIRERLHKRIFPVLRGTGLHLAVWLLVLDEENEAHLYEPRGLPSYVGYDPLRDAEETSPPPRVLLFSGPIPEKSAHLPGQAAEFPHISWPPDHG